jgi:type VI secretion system secreted protein Hcp
MSIKGTKQGDITKDASGPKSMGNLGQKGHENEVIVQAFRHEVVTPTDPQSGQPTGQRVHRPVIVTKVYDKTSPQLYQALCTGERLTEVEIHWFRTSKEGKQEHYFTHKLTDAVIVNIKAVMPNCQDPSQSSFTHLEEVAFSYRKIEWTHVVAGVSAMDDWQEPVV